MGFSFFASRAAARFLEDIRHPAGVSTAASHSSQVPPPNSLQSLKIYLKIFFCICDFIAWWFATFWLFCLSFLFPSWLLSWSTTRPNLSQ
jgi:hypothetical protein